MSKSAEPTKLHYPVRAHSERESGWDQLHGRTVLCPVCQFEANHIDRAEEIPSKDDYSANWGGRGEVVVVYMYCENGHKWELCLGFHKGEVVMFARTDNPPAIADGYTDD